MSDVVEPSQASSTFAAIVTTGFFALPTELRNQIYELVLVTPEPILMDQVYSHPEQPALLRTSRQIRLETLPIFFGQNTLLFHYPTIHSALASPRTWTKKNARHAQFINRIVVDFVSYEKGWLDSIIEGTPWTFTLTKQRDEDDVERWTLATTLWPNSYNKWDQEAFDRATVKAEKWLTKHDRGSIKGDVVVAIALVFNHEMPCPR